MTNQTEEFNILKKFMEPFISTTRKMLIQALDNENYKNLEIKQENVAEISDADEIKSGNVIYKIDYATGKSEGSFAILIPEILISQVADLLTGGSGDLKPKESITELEVNSVSGFLDRIFREFEAIFKRGYGQELAFSASPSFILKENPNYEINTNDAVYDLRFENKLVVGTDFEHSINILWNLASAQNIISELDLHKNSVNTKKTSTANLDINRLSDVKIKITAELGRSRVPIKYALELVRGSLVELDTIDGADIKVFANGIEFGYAQVVAIEDSFGLKITKIISPEGRLECI